MSRGPVSAPAASGPELLKLARSDRAAARARLRGLAAEELASACQDLRPGARGEYLLLLDHPEEVVPLLPPAELAATIVESGMSEGAWLLEIATSEQRVACFDLDCWDAHEVEPGRILSWIDALVEAGRPTLVKALHELDLELWLIALAHSTDVCVIGKEDEAPPGWFTEDGVCYFLPRSDEAFARVAEIARTSFHEAQPLYWQLVYGLLFESPAECQEFALKWRTARLGDLGFPDREFAMQAYKPLPLEEAPVLEAGSGAANEARAVVPARGLPQQLRGSLVGDALAQLGPERAADVLGYVLAVANTVAVAERLRLSDPDSIPRATEKAVRGIDRGLRELAKLRQQAPADVLDCTRPLDLFRIGATLDPALHPERRDSPGEDSGEEDAVGNDAT